MKLLPVLLSALAVASCAKTTQVNVSAQEIEAYASDSINVWKPLEAGSSVGELYRFGNAEGRKFSERFSTDSTDVYLEFNVTLLELNPAITRRLHRLVADRLRAWGFTGRADTIPGYKPVDVDPSRHLQYEIMRTLLADTGAKFENFKDSIFSVGPNVSGRLIYDARIDIYPVWMKDDFVTYAVQGYDYTGGAHGEEFNQLITFSISTGDPVTIAQIADSDKERLLHQLAARHMAGHNYFDNLRTPTLESYLDSLNRWLGYFPTFDGSVNMNGMKDITADNFPLPDPGFTSEGLVFVYPKYMLAPGAAGTPQVVLTREEVRPLLKAPFNSLE